MAKYTTEVRTICEQAAGYTRPTGYDEIDDVLTESTVNAVMPNYPIFDESYRYTLNKKILEHYYTKEIGFETVGLWKLKLRARMNEIMPYYNKLYESEKIKFDPLKDIDLVTSKVGSKDETSKREGTVEKETDENGNVISAKQRGEQSSSTEDYNASKQSAKNLIEDLAEKISSQNEESAEHSDFENKNASVSEDGTTSEKNETNANVNSTASRDSTGSEDKEGSSDNSTHSTTVNGDVKDKEQMYSDTPQNGLQNVRSGEYLTNATVDNATTDNLANAFAEGDGNYSENVDRKENSTEASNVNSEGVEDKSGSFSKGTQDNESKVSGGDESRSASNESTKNNNNTSVENVSENAENTGNKSANADVNENGVSSQNRTANESTTESADGSANTTEQYIENILGKRGGMSYSKLLMEFRETFLNIDLMIINNLNDLFMGLW